MSLRACLLFVTTVLFAAPAMAQPAYRLQLEKPDWMKDGRVVVMGGVADPKGHRVFLEYLSVLQPVSAVLWTLDDDDDVELALAKDRFDDVIVADRTRGKGAVVHRVRTEGDLRFIVTAKGEPKPYRMAVWVGDEVKLPIASALSPAGGTGRLWGQLAAGGVLVVIVGAVALWFLARRRSPPAAAALLIGVVCVATAGAQGSGPAQVDSRIIITTGTGAEFVRPPGDRTTEEWRQRTDRLSQEHERFGKASQPFDFVNQAVGTGVAAADWWREHRNFTPEDGRFVPEYDPAGSPSLPVSCGIWEDASAGCYECYEAAQNRLNGMRHNLERLRALYESTKRYVDASIAFGDNVSGIHGAMGLAWHAERRGIMASFQKFERTHENKRQEMMASLRSALEDVSACEELYFNNRDWYNRFGFIYYQFMDARYRR